MPVPPFHHIRNMLRIKRLTKQISFSRTIRDYNCSCLLYTSKKGVSRGIFSNEAGLGTGSIAHACADTNNAVHQGMFGIFEVFMDTIVICTLTGLVILLGEMCIRDRCGIL